MCHINLIFRKSKEPSKRLSYYMDFVSWMSYRYNKDGDGCFYFDDNNKPVIIKSEKKLKYFGSVWFFASHQRLTTSGRAEGNTHPHETKDFIMMHNGVFREYGNYDKSDSKVFLEKLQEKYDGEDVLKAIEETTRVSEGTYSILLYEKNTGKLYYFKDSSTSMYVLEDGNYFIMSTSNSNVEYAQHMFSIKKEISEPKPYVVYDVFEGFKQIGKFKDYTDYPENKKKWISWGKDKGSYHWDKRGDTWVKVYDEEKPAEEKSVKDDYEFEKEMEKEMEREYDEYDRSGGRFGMLW